MSLTPQEHLRLGLPVYTFDGQRLGMVSDLGEDVLRVSGDREWWLRTAAILEIRNGQLVLLCNRTRVEHYEVSAA